MALRPGAGGGGSFMFPVAGGLGPPQGMMSMQQQPQQQQQGYGMVPGMQPNMPSMMGMSFGPQIPTGPMAMQGGMTMGQMAAAGMAYMGQPTYMGMRPPTSQYTADMQKQFAEEQQRRYEHQQKILEEERKRRQFEEQKQKLRLLSSVKPKTGEKSRDDALEAIKGNLDGFTREAKMHPTPVSHPTKTGHSMPSHSAVSHPHPPVFHDDDEFCDFIQGPADAPGPSTLSQTFQSSQPAAQARVLPSDQSGSLAHPFPSVHAPASSALLGTVGQIPMNPVTTTSQSESIKGVGVFPSQDPIQPVLPHWIYNDGLVPDLYKKVLETTMTPSGIDTAKLYPILMASGLPRETLGQIWGMANRTTPGQLIKEELYMVLAMIAMTQRGIPAMSLDAFSQLQAAPVPTLSGSPLSMPPTVPPQPMLSMLAAPGVSVPLSIGQPVMGLNMTAPVTSTAPPISTGFMMSFPVPQAAKPEEDDFQEFQDASKSGPIDDSFSDFQGDTPGTFPKSASSQTSAPCVITPVSTTVTSSSDKYAVFTQMTTNKSEAPLSSFTEFGDKYSVFRELEQTAESKPVGDGFEDFRSAGADDGFTDFKTADTISPLETSEKDKPFTASFPPAPSLKQQLQSQQQMQTKLPLKVSDLDLFSLTSSGENKSLSLSQESVSSSFPLPLSSSSTSSNAAGKSSTLVDDFGDFSIFGDSSSATSSGRNDFADFMAFSNTTGFSEQKSENKYNTLKQEGGSVLTSNSYMSVNENGQHHLSSVSDKYDVFKQLSLEGFEEQKDSTFSSVKSEDDFADFQTGKFSSGLSNSDKVLIDKVAAFRHAKEDSASVKSLDLPSIGGSSIGKEDSEDALSVQFDMKLSDVGGDLKHVMSDSSLDLPPVSGQHPPAADMDDLKFLSLTNNSNSSAINNLAHCETAAVDQPSAFFLSSETMSSSTTSILQRKETSFGSSENITMTVTSKVTTCLNKDSSTTDNFDEFTDFKDHTLGTAKQIMDSEFGNFAGTLPDVEISLSTLNQNGVLPSFASNGVPSDLEKKELTDDFGEFQREKPKISKFDFLVASSQGKIKSSEEMIKNELATFDLSVQGSHKRSLSLGDKEINHTVHPPPQEQGFRDRSNTLNERPALPVIRDRYKDLTGEVEESERYAYEWQRCLESVLQVIRKANDTLNGISSSSICTEVIQSTQGMEYLLGVVEVYRVARRVELGIKATAVCSEKLQHLLKDIERVWNNLIGFMSLASLTPDDSSLDFSTCMLRPGIKNAKELACGVCLLNVESRSKAFDSEIDCFKLAYGGHQYHASCANFWINCVEPKPPGLVLPDLL